MAIARGKHWTDERVGGRSAKRTIRNHANYETAGGIIAPTSQGVDVQPGPPAHWSGQWDFSHAQIDAPLQVYTRDSTDAGNRALMGINPSHRPDVWATWKAVNANSCEPVIDGGTIFYPGLWDGASWRLVVSAHKVKDYIELESNAAPSSYRWTLKLAPGCNLDPRADGIHLLDGAGSSHGKITYPIAWDENGSEMEPNLGVSMGFGDPVGPYATIEITLDPVDFAAAVGAIVIDPTLNITGTTDIEDASGLAGAHVDKNTGGSTIIYTSGTGSAPYNTGLVRVKAAAIPAGSLSSSVFHSYKTLADGPTSVEHYRLVDANDWVEGTSPGAVQVGSCCYNYAKYNTQAWVGGATGGAGVGDYTADASPPTQVGTLLGWQSLALPVVWFSDWRDAVRVDNGFVRCESQLIDGRIDSTEAANALYFVVDYTTGPAGIPPIVLDRRS